MWSFRCTQRYLKQVRPRLQTSDLNKSDIIIISKSKTPRLLQTKENIHFETNVLIIVSSKKISIPAFVLLKIRGPWTLPWGTLLSPKWSWDLLPSKAVCKQVDKYKTDYYKIMLLLFYLFINVASVNYNFQ